MPWVPVAVMLVYTVCLASVRNFIPDDISLVSTYFVLMGLLAVPKVIFAVCSALGLGWKKMRRSRYNWGNLVAVVLILFTWYVVIYGSTIGLRQLKISRVDVWVDDLPDSFEGYRIVHFSDAHVGTFVDGRTGLLRRALDSINAQHPDLIAFTGDLQNLQPQEIYPVQDMLGQLKAGDGVVSVLGNHDYSEYVNEDPLTEAANCSEIIARQRKWGWKLLLNENLTIRRGSDSIVIAGEENLERPDRADFGKTMQGVGKRAFVVMLQHNPKAWDRYIRASNRVQLTLSGHVHGGQISLFGLRPSSLKYRQDYGLYEEDGKALYVSSGIGGLLPFRFGVPPEIAVITLHKRKL